jgi:Cu2+-exporting ATPase
LIRDREAFERARKLDAVIFDKTGTLTTGEFSVTEVVVTGEREEQDIRDLAASVEAHSEHPIARAITAAGVPRDVRRFEAIPGEGAQAQVYDDTVVVANRYTVRTPVSGSQKRRVNWNIKGKRSVL